MFIRFSNFPDALSTLFSKHFATIACNKGGHVEFTLATLVVHVPNFSEYLTLLPAHIVDATDRPHATY